MQTTLPQHWATLPPDARAAIAEALVKASEAQLAALEAEYALRETVKAHASPEAFRAFETALEIIRVDVLASIML